jgi:predicted  nucleic acid-binding Zn-ribbon protein
MNMSLDNGLISQFVKLTNDNKRTKTESSTYGTIVEYNGSKYVKFDGSELLTPFSSTTNVKDGERVTVTIKDHSAIVTGNLSSPSARDDDVKDVRKETSDEIGKVITSVETLIADKVDTKEFNAEVGRINTLVSDNVIIKGTLTANSASIRELESDNVTVRDTLTALNADITNLKATDVTITGKLNAADADIKSLQTDTLLVRDSLTAVKADISELETDNVTIKETLTAQKAEIKDLDTKKLSAEEADIKYANIDFTNIGSAAIEEFFAKSGMIKDVVVGDGTITGTLVGVTITGDLIKGNTIVADKLVIKGDDGLYYKLNTDGTTVEEEQTDHNSLNGSVIMAKTITATKINVDDLVAFDATIGGFHITDSALYSGVKESIDNTTRGIYMDSDGQICFGDSNSYIKYYEDTDGTHKLAIAASVIRLGGTGENVEEALAGIREDTQDAVDKATAANDTASAAQDVADSANSLAESNSTKILNATLEIDSINATISNLVTGEHGESLMTQTDSGWTFSIAAIQNALSSVSSNVDNLNTETSANTSSIDILKQNVEDLGEYRDYIKFGTDNGKPCIILGETDSTFKVIITNTDIRFTEGSGTPAYISNQSLHISKAVIQNELSQGDFVWTARSNGNYGILWRG